MSPPLVKVQILQKDFYNLEQKKSIIFPVFSIYCLRRCSPLRDVTSLTPCVCTPTGVVPEPPSQVEEEGALRPDPAGQDSLCGHVRSVGDTARRHLHAGKWRLSPPIATESVFFSPRELEGHLAGIKIDGSALVSLLRLHCFLSARISGRSIHHLL